MGRTHALSGPADESAGSPAGPDQKYLDETFSGAGAWLVGRVMHDAAEGWGDDPGVRRAGVRRHPPPAPGRNQGQHDVRVRHRRAAAALARARAAAGDRDVLVMGGANLTGQYLNAGEFDELTVTVAPVLLGAGKRFFGRALRPDLTLEPAGVIESPFVTHLRYRCSVKE